MVEVFFVLIVMAENPTVVANSLSEDQCRAAISGSFSKLDGGRSANPLHGVKMICIPLPPEDTPND